MAKSVIIGLLATLAMLALLPFALVARSRATRNGNLPVHLVMDMVKQSKYKAQRLSEMFADDRAMRPQVEGTLAQEDMMVPVETLDDPAGPHPIDGRDEARVMSNAMEYAAVMWGRNRRADEGDDEFFADKPISLKSGSAKDSDIANDPFYVKKIPSEMKVTMDFVKRGQERFNIYCLPCHGVSGYGDGPVAQRAKMLQDSGAGNGTAASGWVAPQNLIEAKIISRPDGHIFNTITNGIRNMPRYDKQISIADRWAIIAYLRALERSQNALPEDLTPEEKKTIGQ